MSLFLDSADIEEVKRAVNLGFVSGVTTNPSIMARVKNDRRDVIRQICELSPGPVFYQVTGKTPLEREQEARDFFAICPDKVVLKIPATTENLALAARLSEDIPCAATAVYSGAQTLVACEAGCRYVIPYVNRTTRLTGDDGCELVAEMFAIVEMYGKRTQIVAASIKSAEEAARASIAGAHHLTMPLDVLLSLGNHRFSDDAIAEFNSAGR